MLHIRMYPWLREHCVYMHATVNIAPSEEHAPVTVTSNGDSKYSFHVINRLSVTHSLLCSFTVCPDQWEPPRNQSKEQSESQPRADESALESKRQRRKSSYRGEGLRLQADIRGNKRGLETWTWVLWDLRLISKNIQVSRFIIPVQSQNNKK